MRENLLTTTLLWKNSNLNIRMSAEERSCREGVTKVGELDGDLIRDDHTAE